MTVAWGAVLSMACVRDGQRATPCSTCAPTHLANGAKDGLTKVHAARLAGAHSANKLGSKLESFTSVEGGLGEGKERAIQHLSPSSFLPHSQSFHCANQGVSSLSCPAEKGSGTRRSSYVNPWQMTLLSLVMRRLGIVCS